METSQVIENCTSFRVKEENRPTDDVSRNRVNHSIIMKLVLGEILLM